LEVLALIKAKAKAQNEAPEEEAPQEEAPKQRREPYLM